MPAKPRRLPLAAACLLALGSNALFADVLNVEFKFTPYTGDTKDDHVSTVAGKAKVFINNVPVAEREVGKQEVPVLFDEREIASSVWVPVRSIGPVLRKGKNAIRIEFEPSEATPYKAQFSWAEVTDQTTEQSEPGRVKSTNQSGEGKEEKQATGKLVFERAFTADFAEDRPWHHYPPVASLSEEDRQALGNLLRQRAEAFKPKFDGVYTILASVQGIDIPGVRKAKCLDKAYTAGVRIAPPPAEELEFTPTGNPEVVLGRKGGPLFAPDSKAFERIKGDEAQMCAGIALSVAYPPQLIVVRQPDGSWQTVQ